MSYIDELKSENDHLRLRVAELENLDQGRTVLVDRVEVDRLRAALNGTRIQAQSEITILHARCERAEKGLQHITDSYEARSELFTSAEELALNLYDWAKKYSAGAGEGDRT